MQRKPSYGLFGILVEHLSGSETRSEETILEKTPRAPWGILQRVRSPIGKYPDCARTMFFWKLTRESAGKLDDRLLKFLIFDIGEVAQDLQKLARRALRRFLADFIIKV